MPEPGRMLFDLFLLFTAAKLAGAAFARLRQPAVVGEILAGALIGPHLLGLVSDSELHNILAELGVVFLLFAVGLETQPTGLWQVGRQAAAVGIAGIAVPFALALLLMQALGKPLDQGLFVGAALMATSVGITARVLSDLGYLGTRVARIILGAAVLDDILGMLVLALVVGFTSGAVSAAQILLLAGEALAFLLVAVFVARSAVRHLSPRLSRAAAGGPGSSLFALAIALCFAFSALADVIGLAAIIGAFFAGIVFAEIREAPELRRSMAPIYQLLVPIFFVLTGARVDVPRLLTAEVLPVGLLITAVAVIGKLAACGPAAYRLGAREALAVGVGMTPRGEVGIIIALIGLTRGVISGDVYSQVILMSILTSLFAPSLLRKLLVPSAPTPPAAPGSEGPPG